MDWKELLKEKAVLVCDGAWGTELAARGLPAGTAPELWNAENREAVKAVAHDYVDAGADIILTNTFGGSRFKLAKSGLDDRTVELNRLGAEISKEAAGDRALVFASVGPTGEFMQPLGLKTAQEFVDCFAEQIAAIAAGGADGLVIESMSDIGEARAALKAARSVCSLPAVVSMTFSHGPKGYATMMGVKPEQAATEFEKADLVGSNCGAGIDNMLDVAQAMRAATRKPLWIKSNAGVPQLVDGKTVFRETPDVMASKVQRLIEIGANVIGGCCGSTPEHIRQMRARVDQLRDLARSVSAEVIDAL